MNIIRERLRFYIKLTYLCRANFRRSLMMKDFKRFSIPIKGLGTGLHNYTFELNEAFFKHFEASPIHRSEVRFAVSLDKRPDMLVLDMNIEGWYETSCDRCLQVVEMPLEDAFQLLVKFSEQLQEEEADIVYISRAESHLNIAKFVYEYTCLAIPSLKNCEEDRRGERDCDEEVVRHLDEEAVPDEKPDSPVWDALKSLKFDDKK